MDDKNPEYQLNIEEELPNISQSPKVFKISLIILICASVLMIAAIITLAILYKDELSKNSQNNQSTNTQPNPQPNPQIDSYSFFGNVSYNITYDEDGKIPNSFKNGGENYIESLGPVNNNQDYEKNDRNVYTLYIPQFALDRKEETNGIILWVHGGAWIHGDKEEMEFLCKLYSQQGYITATVGYTILSEPYNNFNIYRIMDEITACIKSIKNELEKKEFDVNKLKMAIGGYSAGGHLSLLYTYLIKNFTIPIGLEINYVGPIGIDKKYFYKLNSSNETFESIEDIATIEQAVKEQKIIPIFDEKTILMLLNAFNGNKYKISDLLEMLDKNGTIIEENEKYQKMLHFAKFGFITDIDDYHKDMPTMCIYGGTDTVLGIGTYAYLKEKAKKDGRKLDYFYSRYEGHALVFPFTDNGKQVLWNITASTMENIKKYFGY